jgi:NADPH:quinone reductase-like Zn-dependent oxidoreductase
MKAIVCTQYGPPEVLHLKEIEKPVPKDNEVLIRVYATTVTATDCMMRKGDSLVGRLFLGLRKPRKNMLGIEFAGEIEAVGKRVTRLRKGDRVFGAAMGRTSCTAEYACLPEKAGMTTKPATMTYAEAAAFCDGALTALTFLQDIGKIQCGQHVLINGASGSVGTFAVQLAKYFGAKVTGVCSATNVEMVKSLGADRVIDYTKEDFTAHSETYDMIFDTIGKSSFSRCQRALKPGGVYLTTIVWEPGVWFHMLRTSLFGSKKAKTGGPKSTSERLDFLKGLVEAGKLRPVIDKRYPLEQIVEAHRYVDTGHKKGNVVIMVGRM